MARGGCCLNQVLTYNLAGVAVGLYLNRVLTYNLAGVAVGLLNRALTYKLAGVAIGHFTFGLYLERFRDFFLVNRALTYNFSRGGLVSNPLQG